MRQEIIALRAHADDMAGLLEKGVGLGEDERLAIGSVAGTLRARLQYDTPRL